ncbi:hypothetical protein [Kaistia algarum]|nr:hypothetical protein [Kaistia algarum]MCX5516470.1 hypothetical protein [Kaistia algarum]
MVKQAGMLALLLDGAALGGCAPTTGPAGLGEPAAAFYSLQ